MKRYRLKRMLNAYPADQTTTKEEWIGLGIPFQLLDDTTYFEPVEEREKERITIWETESTKNYFEYTFFEGVVMEGEPSLKLSDEQRATIEAALNGEAKGWTIGQMRGILNSPLENDVRYVAHVTEFLDHLVSISPMEPLAPKEEESPGELFPGTRGKLKDITVKSEPEEIHPALVKTFTDAKVTEAMVWAYAIGLQDGTTEEYTHLPTSKMYEWIEKNKK